MTRSSALTDVRDPRGGFVVGKPRPSDAVGSSLRNVYEADPRLPSELASLLRHLDARTR